MPSDGRPRLSWNLRSASSVNAPKMPSVGAAGEAEGAQRVL